MKALLQQALEAREAVRIADFNAAMGFTRGPESKIINDFITAVEKHCEQAEQAQPVYQYRVVGGGWKDCSRTLYEQFSKESITTRALYTHPQPSKPLSYERISKLVDTCVGGPSPSYPLDQEDWINFTRAVEAAHGIKEQS